VIPDSKKVYFNVTEAAKRVGVSRDTLHRHIREGKVRVYRGKVGKRPVTYIFADDLADYALQHQRGAGIPGA